jgi:hypothetical protein
MAYRNKVYVAFDGDNDIHFYRLMTAWHQNDRSPFNFYDAHELNNARDTSTEQSIKAQLRLRMANSKTFVILIGSNTRYLYRFVKWEMELALYHGLPIIAVNLNGMRWRDDERCPATIRDGLTMHISYNPAIMQYSLEQWPDQHRALVLQGRTGPYYYNDSTYKALGL